MVRFCCIFCSGEERCIKDLSCFNTRSLLCVRTSVERVSARRGLRTARNATLCNIFLLDVETLSGNILKVLLIVQQVCRNDHYSKLHMQCKATASDVEIRSLKIVFSGQRAINLLAMYSSI